jgi:hypothetical protein
MDDPSRWMGGQVNPEGLSCDGTDDPSRASNDGTVIKAGARRVGFSL